MSDGPNYHDPRMRGFRSRTSVEDAQALIARRVSSLTAELIPLDDASGRVLAADVTAEVAVPPFDRAAMDGYALRGEETFGADATARPLFRLVGRSRPGSPFGQTVGPRRGRRDRHGAPMPIGADAVLKVESSLLDGGIVLAFESNPPGRNVGRVGEDIPSGTSVFVSGRVLRPQDLGILSALGYAAVTAIARPRVTILITGDELLAPGSSSTNGRIADMNSVMLSALIRRDGGIPRVVGPLPDDRETIRSAIAAASQSDHAVIVSGGSSTGPEDHAPSLVAELGELAIHGVALRPASPSGIGFVAAVAVMLLPGNPVSALCGYDFFAARIVRRLGGRSPDWPYRSIDRALGEKLPSALGRADYARVLVKDDLAFPFATSGASILSSTTRADGFVVVPASREGYPRGHEVTVWLYGD